MFYLNTGVHFYKVRIVICVNKKFQGAGVAVGHLLARRIALSNMICLVSSGTEKAGAYSTTF